MRTYLRPVALAIDWPIPLAQAELSAKDRAHPRLADVTSMPASKILVIGSGGQLGHALAETYRGASYVEFVDYPEFDLTAPDIGAARHWREYGTIINAAAYTAVDAAETPEGRSTAWAVNVAGLATLARVATDHNIMLVHVSSDYVFDGTSGRPYREDDPLCPLGVYAQTKAAGDQIVATVPRHYIVRTSWVIGDGKNFVRTMASLAEQAVNPSVVDDQVGRLTFTSELARGIRHLLDSRAAFGLYNLTGTGPVMSWAQIARQVFALTGHDPDRVTPVSTADYFASANGPVAPRPHNSALDLSKIEGTGFDPAPTATMLPAYVSAQPLPRK